MSLADAIERNRARQAQKRAGVPSERRDEALRAYTVNILVCPPVVETVLFGRIPYEEKRTIYGTSLADAKKRAGIE
jgi:hypothetical protein